MGEFGYVENKAHCSVLDTLQGFSHRGWESNLERVTVVQEGDDQELHCILFEQRPDPVDVVEGKCAGLGHSSDVGGAGQSIVEDYSQVPRSCSEMRVAIWMLVEDGGKERNSEVSSS